jgi:putative oxidoreductase
MSGKGSLKDLIGLLSRLALGGVFLYSGAIKALSPAEEFAYAIESYKVLNAQLSLYSAYAVPWIELWAGLLLAAGVFTRANALFLGGMLVFFELLLGQAWLRKLPITSCGCFGSSGGNSIEVEFVQNLVLLALAWAAWRYGGRWSADEYVATL